VKRRVELRGNKGRFLDQKANARNLYLSKETKLGELDHINFMFKINCMMYNMIMYDSSLPLLEFCVSRNFSETSWRAFKAVRRLMPLFCEILGSCEATHLCSKFF